MDKKENKIFTFSIKKPNKDYILLQNIKSKKDSRVYYFDWLRLISSFSVVLIHVSAQFYYKQKVDSYKWKIAYYYNGLSRFGVPTFFMISGALFLKVDISILKIYNKYIKRLFIHLLIWSVIYSYSKIQLSKIDLKKVVNLLIEGHYHLWYLFATIKLYAIIPFSREIARNEKLLKYYIIIFFIFLFLIPNYIYFLSYYSKRISNLLNKIYLKLRFTHSFDNFYFCFGYYLSKKKPIKSKIRIIIYIFGLIGVLITTKISYNVSFKKKKKINHFFYKYFNVFFTSTSLFIFFKNNFNNLTINKKNNNIIQKISRHTFGIYLIHPLIIEKIIIKLHLLSLTNNVLFLIPFISIIVFALSLLISIILKFVPLLGYYLI